MKPSPTPRQTKQRLAIRRALESAGRPLSPAELRGIAGDRVPRLGLATVYREIKRLVDEGFASVIHLPGEPPRYELQRRADSHHHHFRCEQCERVYDVEGCPDGIDGLVVPPGFLVEGHEITLYGTCQSCAPKSL